MKNALIIVIVVVLALLGIALFTKNNSEAPYSVGEEPNNTGALYNPNETPAGYNTPVTPDYVTPVINPNAPVKTFSVEGKNFSFTPSVIKVKKGDKVVINFKNTQGFHDLVIDEFKVATKQIKTDEQDSISFIADKTGSFEYYCSVGTHRQMGMKGTLVVE